MPKPGARTPKAGPVIVAKVDPEVWATALVLAHGILTRIERVSETEVIVHNQQRTG